MSRHVIPSKWRNAHGREQRVRISRSTRTAPRGIVLPPPLPPGALDINVMMVLLKVEYTRVSRRYNRVDRPSLVPPSRNAKLINEFEQ